MRYLFTKVIILFFLLVSTGQTNDDIKKLENDIKKAATDIAETLKIEIAIRGKKLENFFINNDLILISENGSREYRFKEKTYEIIKNDTVIQNGSWKVHGLLKNQIRLISDNDKKKYYLKKISKKPWIYNYDKLPGSEGTEKKILHIKSSSKFTNIVSDVTFSSSNENFEKLSKKNENKKKEQVAKVQKINEVKIKEKIAEEPSQTLKVVEKEEEKKNLETNCKINSTNNIEEEETVLKKTGDVEIKDQNEILYLLKKYIILMEDDGAQLSKAFEWNFKDDCSLDIYVDYFSDDIIKSYMIFSGSWNIKDNKILVKLKSMNPPIEYIEEEIIVFKWIPEPSSVVVSSAFGEVRGSLLENSLFHDVVERVGWSTPWFSSNEFRINLWDKKISPSCLDENSEYKKNKYCQSLKKKRTITSQSKWESSKTKVLQIQSELRRNYKNKKRNQENHQRKVNKYGKQCENSENFDDCLLKEEKKYWKFLDEEFIRKGGKDSLRKVIDLIISCAISVDQQELSLQKYSGIKNDINKAVFRAEEALRNNNLSEIRISHGQLRYLAHQAYSVSATNFGPDNIIAQNCRSIDTDFKIPLPAHREIN